MNIGYPVSAVCAVAVALLWPLGVSSSPAATGRVSGTVTLVAPAGAPLPSGAYPSRRVNRPAPAASELANVIVFIQDAPASGKLPVGRATISQRDESFIPRVVAITRGSAVDFPNFDPYFHNVFSLSRGAAFDLGRYPKGESRARTFTRPGLVKVFCHIHSDMSASIMVFDHPFYTAPGGDGSYSLDSVPPGKYRLIAWHERIGESVRPLDVTAGGTARADFALPVETR